MSAILFYVHILCKGTWNRIAPSHRHLDVKLNTEWAIILTLLNGTQVFEIKTYPKKLFTYLKEKYQNICRTERCYL